MRLSFDWQTPDDSLVLAVRLRRFRADLRMRSQWLSAALDRLASLREINWLAVLGLVVSLDVAKVGFVLVWAETAGWWTPPAWLPDEALALAYLLAYAAGVSNAIYFFRRIRQHAADPPARLLPRLRRDEPPEPRHCGIPVPPKMPSPLAAHCHASPSESTPAQETPKAEKLPGRSASRRNPRPGKANQDKAASTPVLPPPAQPSPAATLEQRRAILKEFASLRARRPDLRDPIAAFLVEHGMFNEALGSMEQRKRAFRRLIEGERYTLDHARRHELRRSL